ncbi:orexin receptor type 1 isoform X1 [Fukomys damarensis]|uniref:orexin receptor type 1 isoform X1 n=1 Tax=Fukomys damarensis TaxID=885580 RepID=UPI00053F30E6|nr:orexin receptor type 1 isoform X1 [Fukomys damarensis]XP_033623406.1 orexin receptor type 1 isoform X1 [Fukomys damarensis]XP_033623407.1 orexin receptor type 1 isoform X1 [Fukomys damarensis]XP_033623408.1 orexin receptor type 1 isoform X1 [Fukomys damarensis]XP_033623409.1 orexin receptor type 1 isoform X1 [Fukomys damarensis]XP_033623410.1 orexin receptor type 1 isoform X1 [Fukomys damarensis]
MEPSTSPGAQMEVPTGSEEPSSVPPDYEDEFLLYLWRDYLYPKQYEWVLIAAYVAVFLIALVGNTLVCLAVWRNHHMRTVTNYFIVNLSLADVLVTAICLPASLLVDITESWLFGHTLCKVIPYLQAVSVSVAVLTLSFIALDRWYAICHPLLFKSTARRTRGSILGIWAVSLTVMVPQAAVMECSSALPELANRTRLFSVCDEHWADELYPRIYHSCFFVVTYLAPLSLMAMAYFQIFRKLWGRQIPGTTSALVRNWKRPSDQMEEQGQGLSVEPQPRARARTFLAEVKQMRARRKTAKMLMVVLLVFALCYLPISVLNVLKRVFGMFHQASDREAVYACFTFSHWLVYANSAANPIIYNFLSGKFREQFKAAFSCCLPGVGPCGSLNDPRLRSSASHKSLSLQSQCSVSKVSEHVVLTSVTTVLP